jgi:hypothetical protein
MSQSNLSKIKPSLRTSGAVTGNFGKAKVKSGSQLNDVPANKRDSLGNFPRVDEYAERLRKAYSLTSDHKLRSFILAELGKIERTRIDHEERYVKPQGPYCSLSNHFVTSSQH